MTTEKPRILLARPLDEAAEARLTSAATVVRPTADAPAELCELVRDCDALVVGSKNRVNAELLQAGSRLRVVGTASVGTDHIDMQAAKAAGIAIINTPEASADSVAELTLTLILHLLRPVLRLTADYAGGAFEAARRSAHGSEMRGLTLGIIGMGRIGSRVGRICAAGIGANVLYNDIADVGPFSYEARRCEKDEIWSKCDIVTLHVPLTELTRRLVDAAVLSRFKPGAILINTARGELVDTPALLAALHESRLGGAGLDVTDPEPLPSEHPLWRCATCILTPHIAARTTQAMRRMYAVADRVLEYLRTRT